MFGRSKPPTNRRACVQAELGRDLAPGRRIGGRGQRDPGHRRPALAQDGELEILRAEVVAPLRDAVRLVDREQRERQPVEPVEEAVGEQPLGRDVEQVDLARGGLPADPALLRGREAGVQELGADAELAQRGHLVLHQRDQRADDDRRCRRAAGPGAGSTATCRCRSASPRARRRRPATQRTIASCSPRKALKPKTSCRTARGSAGGLPASNRSLMGEGPLSARGPNYGCDGTRWTGG